MPMPKDLTTNLIEQVPEEWEGCDHLDCLPGCWLSEWHCERLAVFIRERDIARQPYNEETQKERMACGLAPDHD